MEEHLRETRLTTQRLYTGRAISLDVDRIRLPSGRETTREIVRHPGSVVIVPVLDDGRLLLIRQFRYAVGEALWEFPAGTLDRAAESPEACAHRELEEETGYCADRMIRLGEFFTAPGFTDERMHVFQAEGLHPTTQRLESDELIEVFPFPWDVIEAKVRAGEIRDGKTLAALHLHALMRRA
ncbi:MAG: NUDIX hydrolase [Blastocatellia bacterium]|nr:NUDIX hydrolase [Blastocatellia bacterium]MCS7156589.1 NUDIX hydrolase [Blastocatellia bacterium]MCX7751669.1 NUDIX hydrolase [Blastocatellia bacterium]MDW8168769.1 NUDIX hydrolase [Acidobacteriota bacterium]MDW8257035.1 NUDIX hydrolase [Acidobacteriota bacterium]